MFPLSLFFCAFSIILGYAESFVLPKDQVQPRQTVSPSLDGSWVSLPPLDAGAEAPFSWWYLDLVGDDPVYTAQVIFYAGYPFGQLFDTPYYVQIVATLRTIGFNHFTPVYTQGSVFSGDTLGSNGDWAEGGNWVSTNNGKDYFATFNTSVSQGQLTMQGFQHVPAHYPCDSSTVPSLGSNSSRTNVLSPNLGWTNIIPGGRGRIELSYQGQSYSFTGYAYHDQNFGLTPLPSTVNQWIWARGTVGPYTFVFLSNKEKGSSVTSSDPSDWDLSGYLSVDTEEGELLNFCTSEQSIAEKNIKNLKIETWGDIWSSTPAQTGSPLQFTDAENGEVGLVLTFSSGDKVYKFTISSVLTVLSGVWVPYARFSGSATGGEVGGAQANGSAIFEYINYGE